VTHLTRVFRYKFGKFNCKNSDFLHNELSMARFFRSSMKLIITWQNLISHGGSFQRQQPPYFVRALFNGIRNFDIKKSENLFAETMIFRTMSVQW